MLSEIDALLETCRDVNRSLHGHYLRSSFFQHGVGGRLAAVLRLLQQELGTLRAAVLSGVSLSAAPQGSRPLVFVSAPHGEHDSLSAYHELFNLLAEQVELADAPPVGSPLQDALLEALLCDDNLYHRKAEREPPAAIGAALREAYVSFLRAVSAFVHFDVERLMLAYQEINRGLLRDLQHSAELAGIEAELRPAPRLALLQPCQADASRPPVQAQIAAAKVKTRFLEGSAWEQLADDIADFFFQFGRDERRNFLAFIWRSGVKEAPLQGIRNYQDVRLDHLVGYELHRQDLIDNTVAFLDGYDANNALLYGARGTGKSSHVRALLNEFSQRGLRIIEIDKSQIFDLRDIISEVRQRKEKFIIFCDDLSFEVDDTTYKHMKVVMDGTLEERASNVLFYATSNTKDLVKRPRLREGLHYSEERAILDEKRGIDDRFGLKIHFELPDQKIYRRMLLKHAELQRLSADPEELFAQFRIWCGMNNHDQPSGRTARDFIKWFVARQAMG